jgi:hypothetical protein
MIWVDSAHGAILDAASLRPDDHEAYLDSWGDIWNPSKGIAWMYPNGVVSDSNLGDGYYPVRSGVLDPGAAWG